MVASSSGRSAAQSIDWSYRPMVLADAQLYMTTDDEHARSPNSSPVLLCDLLQRAGLVDSAGVSAAVVLWRAPPPSPSACGPA